METLQGMQQAQFEFAESLRILRETQGPTPYQLHKGPDPRTQQNQTLSLLSKMPFFLSLLHYLILLPCWKGKGLANQANQGT